MSYVCMYVSMHTRLYAHTHIHSPSPPPLSLTQVLGLENLDPAANYFFACNHESIYDIPLAFACFPAIFFLKSPIYSYLLCSTNSRAMTFQNFFLVQFWLIAIAKKAVAYFFLGESQGNLSHDPRRGRQSST
jgi:hypothetical protein